MSNVITVEYGDAPGGKKIAQGAFEATAGVNNISFDTPFADVPSILIVYKLYLSSGSLPGNQAIYFYDKDNISASKLIRTQRYTGTASMSVADLPTTGGNTVRSISASGFVVDATDYSGSYHYIAIE